MIIYKNRLTLNENDNKMKSEDIKVSVIVCTFNPDIDKLRKTLFSAICQQSIGFEIIIADDGSSCFDEKLIRDFFQSKNFEKYKIYISENNYGTVKNIYNGLLLAKGEYIYVISPGDYFYSQLTLYNLYSFCEKNKCKVCFGDAISYKTEKGVNSFFKSVFPKNKSIYDPESYNPKVALTGFFAKQQPIGASYFRDRKSAISYFKQIVDKVKYVEDYPTTAIYLLEGNRLFYCGEPVVWYEIGDGISTTNSKKWKDRIADDFEASRKILIDSFPQNNILRTKYPKHKYERIMHPIVSLTGSIIIMLGEIKYKIDKLNYDTSFFDYINEEICD